jgi:hypothetical protein
MSVASDSLVGVDLGPSRAGGLLEVEAEPAAQAVGDRQGVAGPGAVLGDETHPAAQGVGVRRCPDGVHHLGAPLEGGVFKMQVGAGRVIHVASGSGDD